MACRAKALGLTGCLALSLLLCSPTAGQESLTPEQASARRSPDFVPVHAGETIVVQGTVALQRIAFPDYNQSAIQDQGHGLVLEATTPILDNLLQGDGVRATGRISMRAGLVVLIPAKIDILSHGSAPKPQSVVLEELQGFRHLGELIMTEGRVIEMGETTAGPYVLIGSSSNPYKLFLPEAPHQKGLDFYGFSAGDTVRAIGIASQYCPSPPHNRWFQLVVARPDDVVRISKGSFFQPSLLFTVFGAVFFISALWWMRDRRLGSQRRLFLAAYDLGEEILGASSPGEVLKRIGAVLPKIFRVTRTHLYVYSRSTRMLEGVQSEPPGKTISVPLDSPAGVIQMGAITCFQNRTLLSIPDTTRSPFPVEQSDATGIPRALMFVPMVSQGEVIGVLQIDQDSRTRDFSPDEQALLQHLGNQAGAAIRLLDQRSVREQLFRSEKLAAVGQLISGVVNELQVPLSTISKMSRLALTNDPDCTADRELRIIATEVNKAAEIVSRLVSFAGTARVEARPFDLNRLLRNLIEFREREWKSRGIRVRDLLMDRPLVVLGSHGQLEQVFLNLLVHGEQSLAEMTEKLIVVRTSVLANRILVEIGFSAPQSPKEVADPFAQWAEDPNGAAGLGVCRSIIAGHGGEARLVRSRSDSRFEIELPPAPGDQPPAPRGEQAVRVRSHPVTALLMEPDDTVQHHLLTLLASRGYRVVPVLNADSALDLAQRMRFDVAFCSVRLPGLNWVELSERIQSRVSAFILLSDGYDPDMAASFEGDGRYVVSKPVDDAQLNRLLRTVEAHVDAQSFAG